jgi:hypothetical protein
MTDTTSKPDSIMINRAPVLTLWASVVAECLGFEHNEALTFGRAVAGLNAYSKGVALGLFQPSPKEVKEKRKKIQTKETVNIDLLRRAVPAIQTEAGLRAISKDKPIKPESVQKYLESKFGDSLHDVYKTMMELAQSLSHTELTQEAYRLYEKFRPAIPRGKKGWGAQGKLDLELIREMIRG